MTLFVVTGPPASGKTTWVQKRARYGDVVIDYDAIVAALHCADDELSGDPAEQPVHLTRVANAARQAAIDEAIAQHDNFGPRLDVYIVHTTPSRQHLNLYRKHGAEMVECDPGYLVCMQRAMAERTPRQQDFVHDWYERRGLAV